MSTWPARTCARSVSREPWRIDSKARSDVRSESSGSLESSTRRLSAVARSLAETAPRFAGTAASRRKRLHRRGQPFDLAQGALCVVRTLGAQLKIRNTPDGGSADRECRDKSREVAGSSPGTSDLMLSPPTHGRVLERSPSLDRRQPVRPRDRALRQADVIEKHEHVRLAPCECVATRDTVCLPVPIASRSRTAVERSRSENPVYSARTRHGVRASD